LAQAGSAYFLHFSAYSVLICCLKTADKYIKVVWLSIFRFW